MLCLRAFAHADVFRPAYLELREADRSRRRQRYDVLWKVPAQGDARLGRAGALSRGHDRQISRRRACSPTAPTSSAGRSARRVDWPGRRCASTASPAASPMSSSASSAQDGTSQVEHLLPQQPQFTVQGADRALREVAWSYLVLGVEHILGGIDHLLFVLALLLIVRGGKRIFATITAFTVAHSITLVAATLGWVHVPGPPVEAMIALSIVFVAAEIVHGLRGEPGLTARAPWVVAFSVRIAAWLRFRRRAGRSRPAAERRFLSRC